MFTKVQLEDNEERTLNPVVVAGFIELEFDVKFMYRMDKNKMYTYPHLCTVFVIADLIVLPIVHIQQF